MDRLNLQSNNLQATSVRPLSSLAGFEAMIDDPFLLQLQLLIRWDVQGFQLEAPASGRLQ